MGTNDFRDSENADYRNGDCIQLISTLDDNSQDLSIFSPPFPQLYTYSDSPHDLGNCKDFDEFITHFSFLIPELFRVMKEGREVCIHCTDIPIQKGKHGYIGTKDFSGDLTRAMTNFGFIQHCPRITIWKDPVIEMQRTKALGLLHKQVKKDSTMSRIGYPDFILVFRKPGENKVPVKNNMPVEQWQRWASPVWFDINYSNTLQYRAAKSPEDEKHICPLQLDVIERLVTLYSNKGETVFSPFAGIASEGYQSILMGRKFTGFELKESYFYQGIKNINHANDLIRQLILQ